LHHHKKLFDSKREGKKNTKINACKCRNPSKVSERAEMRAVEIRTCACEEQAEDPGGRDAAKFQTNR
jgi:hypothetical protein